MKFVSILVYVLTITILTFVHGLPSVNKDEAASTFTEEAYQTSDSTATESKGILQSIADTLKEYAVNKVLDLFKSMPVECKSKTNKSGKLIATKKGKKFCEKKCLAIYDKIDRAKETISTIKSYIPFGQNLKLKARQSHQNFMLFRCARNLTGTKLICDCPRAPELSFGKSLKMYLEKTFLEPSKAARHKNHYPYYNGYGYGPYNNGYGYGPYNNNGYGSYYGHHGFNPLGEFFSVIFYPLKILFFLVTLPFWLFLVVFLGIELEDIFD